MSGQEAACVAFESAQQQQQQQGMVIAKDMPYALACSSFIMPGAT
jgi:hypothetical protein